MNCKNNPILYTLCGFIFLVQYSSKTVYTFRHSNNPILYTVFNYAIQKVYQNL